MESAKFPPHHRHHHRRHHHQLPLQDQLLGSSTTTTLEYPPSAHAWTSNTILNNSSFDSSGGNPATTHSRNPRREQYDHILLSNSQLDGCVTTQEDLSFNDTNIIGNNYTNIVHSVHESQLCRIKRDLSNSCPNLSEMIISSPSSSIEDVQVVLEPTINSYGKNDPNVKLLLSTLSSGAGQSNRSSIFQSSSCPQELIYCPPTVLPKRGINFSSQIYPTINVSNFGQTISLANNSAAGGCFDNMMNLRALDLLNSARQVSGEFRHSSSSSLQDDDQIPNNISNYGSCDYVKQSIQRPLDLEPLSNRTHLSNGLPEQKISNVSSEPKAQKRSRIESTRPSTCQPFKVRKEKLGDRIAALQQLVAPFGKTDTASVLMEAIGYIKFLQNQVETLSVPYLKSSSRNKTASRAMHGGATEVHGSEERKRDLRSRGLCLVPMSCLSYMTDTGGSVWPPPPNFGGGN